jgi:hypothetical protein
MRLIRCTLDPQINREAWINRANPMPWLPGGRTVALDLGLEYSGHASITGNKPYDVNATFMQF